MKILKIAPSILLLLGIGIFVVYNNYADNASVNTNSGEEKKYYFTLKSSDGGTIPASGAERISGEYAIGSEISLLARSVPGYAFDKWVIEDETIDISLYIDDVNKNQAVFIMPDMDITVSATFVPVDISGIINNNP